ncbi:MAG: hypothetical protein LBC84_00220 [Prevotellaceae bacterium]|jgi:hypothetical protein|nr:hypothetical protein [Prevotellaceae bacterium]
MNVIKRTIIPLLMLLMLSECVKSDVDNPYPKSEEVQVTLRLTNQMPSAYITRATDDPNDLMNYVDNVHLLIFDNSNNIIYRTYFAYGVEQNVYLKRGYNYKIFVVANINADNTNINNAEAFFDDVHTLSDLNSKYVVASSRSVLQVGKIIMTSDGTIPVDLTTASGTPIQIPVPLHRLSSKVIFNVFNKVAPGPSNVFPVSWNVIDVPHTSFLVESAQDHPMTGGVLGSPTLQQIQSLYTQSQAELLPLPESGTVAFNGNTYTKQTFEFFSFENRRGNVSGITGTNVSERKALAPDFSTFVQLMSYTDLDRTLLHYIHIGKGRDIETPPDKWFNNYDIDRNAVYHLNVYINGYNNVLLDSRVEYLDGHVIFTLPIEMNRVDGHYMDIPSVLSGLNGYAKIQSGTGSVNAQGQCSNFTPMPNVSANTEGPSSWLRFSFCTPYSTTPHPDPNNPAYTTSPATSLYVSLNAGGLEHTSDATVIVHFDEYLDPQPTIGNPNKRNAVIRVGYVSGAETPAEYELGVANGLERVIYKEVSQYGIKTIGRVGGYDGSKYTSLLGVESVEEYTFQYYTNSAWGSLDEPNPNNGPFWQYNKSSALGSHNDPYDGKGSTTAHYNEYRSVFSGGVPPTRGNTISSGYIPIPNIYNPTHNANATDYCMRKNRDYSGNGIISGNDIKWYTPTPVQLTQISTWRGYLKYPGIDINVGTNTLESNYWTNFEHETTATNAYAMNFASSLITGGTIAELGSRAKSERNRVRCVRDIPGGGDSGDMIYTSGNHLAINLTGQFPPDLLDVTKGSIPGWNPNSQNNLAINNKMAVYFVVSRRYYLDKGNPYITGQNVDCSKYNTMSPVPPDANLPVGVVGTAWMLPTQSELAFIYANVGMLNEMMLTSFGSANYDALRTTTISSQIPIHWAATNNGGNFFFTINFSNGASGLVQATGSSAPGFGRCVRYIAAPLP